MEYPKSRNPSINHQKAILDQDILGSFVPLYAKIRRHGQAFSIVAQASSLSISYLHALLHSQPAPPHTAAIGAAGGTIIAELADEGFPP